jgi:hypothetical protein
VNPYSLVDELQRFAGNFSLNLLNLIDSTDQKPNQQGISTPFPNFQQLIPTSQKAF